MSGERNIPHLRDIFGVTDDMRRMDVKGDDRNSLGGISAAGTDSAISVGSASEEDLLPMKASKKKQHRHRQSGRQSKNNGVIEDDVKHLERHLSMKKTIRKKIMRDLQQAFVEDPDEFKVEDIPPEQLKAELNSRSLSFGTHSKKKGKMKSESNFLDFLRGGNDSNTTGRRSTTYADESDSGHGSPTRELDDDEPSIRKPSFWRRFTIKGAKNKW
ncbi:uncharacterized protein LOC126900413 [Daktulosphaira vitifoliae]|uniref:uncharacterized protein LOC126900413 n=1 Tax=Daktulosphaira vitifoliae TaxID=58002 RepID=UPI0021A9C679|nr:uncharacterized protein LOC126900413 [Daktulosphaira vitifoliae]